MEQVVRILLETTDVIAHQDIQATTVKRVKLSNNTSAKQKFGFIKRVDKGWITTVKDLESWRFER